MPDNVPFVHTKLMSVDLSNEPDAKVDVFVDAIMSLVVDTRDNLEILEGEKCTVKHVMTHKTKVDNHIIRQNLISDENNEAEEAP